MQAGTTNGFIEVRGRTLENDLHTTNGRILADGVDGGVAAKTTNGSIEIRGGNGYLELNTTNGRIELEQTVGRVHAKTTNGSIHARIAHLEESGDFSSSNGSISVRIEEGDAPITETTSNASIDLTLPWRFSGSLDAETRHGIIHTEFPVTATMREPVKNNLSGRVGSGDGPPVRLRTTNGHIHYEEGRVRPDTARLHRRQSGFVQSVRSVRDKPSPYRASRTTGPIRPDGLAA